MDIKKRNMKKDFIAHLPQKIIIEILTRLPVETILRCKCVCKSWRRLLATPEFAKSHMSKSVPGIAHFVRMDKNIEHTNMLDIRHHNIHLRAITKLYSPYSSIIWGSVDGLLLLHICNTESKKIELHLCNPITREYIDLHHLLSQQFEPLSTGFGFAFYGFGKSKISGQYKVIALFHDQARRQGMILPEPECKVYTIGTGSWRSVVPDAMVRYNFIEPGAFVNGNVHWLAHHLDKTRVISCFDLETELFTTFSLPPLQYEKNGPSVFVVAVEGTLCVCEYTTVYSRMVNIWLMKEYGVEESWTKAFVIGKCLDLWPTMSYPIRISNEGIILATNSKKPLFYYSIKTKTTQRICNCEECVHELPVSHIPTFISLKGFTTENSISF